MDDLERQMLAGIREDIRKLQEDFNDLFRNGPISTLNTRVTVVEGKMKVVIGAGLAFGLPVVSYIAVELFKRVFGG